MPGVPAGRPEGERQVAPGVPDQVAAAALAAFSSRDREALLAELVTDSADEEAGVEGALERSLVFSGGGLHVTLRLRWDAPEQVLAADLAVEPPPDGDPDVDVRGRDVPEVVVTGPGQWSISPLTRGPLRVVVASQGRRVQTEWMRC